MMDLGWEMEEKLQVGATEHGHGLMLGRVSKACADLGMKEKLLRAATA